MEGLDASSIKPNSPNPAEEEAKRLQEEQQRRDLLSTILDAPARDRLSRIAMVSVERSKQVETIVLRMAQSGQLRGRVTETQLIDLLDQIEQVQGKGASKKPTIVYRRKGADDDFDI